MILTTKDIPWIVVTFCAFVILAATIIEYRLGQESLQIQREIVRLRKT